MMKWEWVLLFVAAVAFVGCAKDTPKDTSKDTPCNLETPCNGGRICKPVDVDASQGTCVAPLMDGCMQNKLVVCDETAPTCVRSGVLVETAQCEDLSGMGIDFTPCNACDADREVCYVASGAEEAECKGFEQTEPWARCFEDNGTGNMQPQCTQQCKGFPEQAVGYVGCTTDTAPLCGGPCGDDEHCFTNVDVIECTKAEWLPAACNPRNASVSTCKEGEVCGAGNICFTPIAPAD